MWSTLIAVCVLSVCREPKCALTFGGYKCIPWKLPLLSFGCDSAGNDEELQKADLRHFYCDWVYKAGCETAGKRLQTA